MDTESLGGVSGAVDPPAALPKRVFDMRTLEVVEARAAGGHSRARFRFESVVELQGFAGRSNQRALDDVLQLADVTWPVVSFQRLEDV